MLDADARILVCNKRYLEIYGLSPTVVKPGCTLKDLIQHRVAAGYFHGNVDETVNQNPGDAGQRKPSAGTTRLTNGHVISVFTRPMENGGWLVTHQDVIPSSTAPSTKRSACSDSCSP